MISTIAVEDTKFIFATNFSGNPEQDRFGDTRHKANLIIPDKSQADMLINEGVHVRATRPRQDDDPDTFEPEYFVPILVKYRTRDGQRVKYPPKVYLVSGRKKQLLDEDTVDILDHIRVKNVNCVLNPYMYDRQKEGVSLYVRTMYVEQDMDDDPYVDRYNFGSEDDPF